MINMGFGSINDLLKKEPEAGPAKAANLDDAQEKFSHKMAQIKQQGYEVEAQRLAGQIGFPYIALEHFPVSQEALRQVPRDIAEALKAVCFFATPDEVRIGAINPADAQVAELLAAVQDRNHAEGKLYVISEASLNQVLTLYNRLPTIKAITKDVEITEEALGAIQGDVTDFSSFQELLNKQSTTDTVVAILGAALKLNASDVHIENEAERLVVRFRLDGVLHDAAALPKEVSKQLLSRMKLTASLKINVMDSPQDGRFTIKLKEYDVDVRVSTIPTLHGESVVMRLLRQSGQHITLDDLGVRGQALEILKAEVLRPNGMIIITGPTGSGKSTTLYAILTLLNKPGVKIITLEDPVEYRIAGVNQSQIEHTKDYTFAKGLRSILRQDPDVVMVGEIRDLETADTSVQAALTGHLLLSTIHTNSAAGAIPRFLAMGVKPFLLAPALNCVIGQRLVRKVCTECRVKITLPEFPEAMRKKITDVIALLPEKERVKYPNPEFYKAVGCPACNKLGYKGRISIFEIFTVTKAVEKMLSAGIASEAEVSEVIRSEGMISMVEDGILKALDGITTPEEVFRLTE